MKVIALKRTVREEDLEKKEEIFDEIYSSNCQKTVTSVLESSDIVLNILPLTKETENFFNKEKFKKMKKSSFYINIGRGETTNENDLIEVLELGEIEAASLDVFENEPLSPDSPLYSLDNVFVSPHSANRIEGTLDLKYLCFKEKVEKFLKGEELDGKVDIRLGY